MKDTAQLIEIMTSDISIAHRHTKIKESVTFQIFHIANELKNFIKNKKSAPIFGCEISFPARMVLNILWAKDGRTQNEICKITGRSKSTITRIIDGLVSKDLLFRENDSEDKRKKLIFLTEQGKNLEQLVVPHIIETTQKIAENITSEELYTLRIIFNKIYNNIEKINNNNNE